MTNKTLKVLLETMAKNSPYTLGTDYAVSINHDDEDSFRIYIFPSGIYSWFFTSTILVMILSYACTFHLSMYVETKHGVPVVSLSRY